MMGRRTVNKKTNLANGIGEWMLQQICNNIMTIRHRRPPKGPLTHLWLSRLKPELCAGKKVAYFFGAIKCLAYFHKIQPKQTQLFLAADRQHLYLRSHKCYYYEAPERRALKSHQTDSSGRMGIYVGRSTKISGGHRIIPVEMRAGVWHLGPTIDRAYVVFKNDSYPLRLTPAKDADPSKFN